jgi:hypothetical protein
VFTCGRVFVCGTILVLAGLLTAGVSVLASSDLLPQLITVVIVNIDAKKNTGFIVWFFCLGEI